MALDGLRLRHALLPLLAAAAVLALVLAPGLLRPRVEAALVEVSAASPPWLWLAALLCASSLVASSGAWRSALERCGAEAGPVDVWARFCVGTGVNALAPGRLGTAVRFALFARLVPGEGRLWRTGGAAASLGAARSVWTALLVAFAAAAGVVPWWPVAAAAGFATAGVGAALVAARTREPSRRVAHVLDVFRALGREPRAAAGLLGWTGLAVAARVGAVAAVAAAFGISSPLTAALLVVPVLDLANVLPLTPGNVALASAAVAFALVAHGAPSDVALGAGIAFSGVESLTALVSGTGGLLALAGATGGARRWTAAAAGTTACLGLAVAFGATVLAPLV